MASTNVAPAHAGLDHNALARGLGKLVTGKGYDRLVVGGKTLAYLKKGKVTVPAALVAKAPKRLGVFRVERNGRWAGVAIADTAAARAVLEYVAEQRRAAS
jgi:hypothetical protein